MNTNNESPATLLPEIGDYVLATKYSDGDPGDPWALGFYAGVTERGRHLVKDSNGNQIRAGGFRRVGRIEQEVGTWLWNNRAALEASPPGAINLWALVKRDEPDSTAPVASESRGSAPDGLVVPRDLVEAAMQTLYVASDGRENIYAKIAHELRDLRNAAPTPPAVANEEGAFTARVVEWKGIRFGVPAQVAKSFMAALEGTNGEPPDWAIAKAFWEIHNDVDLVGIDASAFAKVAIDKARELARSAAAKGEG